MLVTPAGAEVTTTFLLELSLVMFLTLLTESGKAIELPPNLQTITPISAGLKKGYLKLAAQIYKEVILTLKYERFGTNRGNVLWQNKTC